MKHWIRFLPNVGDPFLARAAELEALSAKLIKTQKRLIEVEHDVSQSAMGDWTEDEIRSARIAAAKASVPEEKLW